MLFGFHHLHKRIRERKRIAEDNEPHFSLKKFILDDIVYFAAILSPIMTIPQVLIIYQNKTASGVSLISWISYFLIALIWLYYGTVHKSKPIIISNTGWIFLSLFIIIGIYIYG